MGYVWAGDPDHGRRLLPALRGGTAPAAERTQELTYLQLQAIDDIPQAPCQRRYWKGHYLREFGDEAIGAFVLTKGEDGVRRAYGAGQMARLTALKDRYDPRNIFHLNHNIPARQSATRRGGGAQK